MTPNNLFVVECPRDAMQGIKPFIDTDKKIRYLKTLQSVGFDTIDIGSLVSPRAIPQMADTPQVLKRLQPFKKKNIWLVIVANLKGVIQALDFDEIDVLGYPFSISENFQMRNTQKTLKQSLDLLHQILSLVNKHNKELVVYLSMGFGNPYGDPWNFDVVSRWVETLTAMGVKTISLSDTIGVSTPKMIVELFRYLIPHYPDIVFGAHIHTHISSAYEKIEAAYLGGCKRFDGTIMGFGGCPMAKDELVGNMPTETIINLAHTKGLKTSILMPEFENSQKIAQYIFNS